MKTKILLLIFILYCFTAQNLFATNIPAGNVYGNWTQANSPYLVLGNITVPQDSLLQIEPGVVVQFQGHYQLHVLGRILALGTASDTITFTALSDWWGIRYDGIQASQDSSLFIYCTVEKGNASGTGNFSNGGAFFILNFSKIRVENCTVTNNTAYINGGGFYIDHASPKIIGNTFSNNTASSAYGGGIYCWYASPSIINNIITNNVSSICCKYSSPIISGNTITHNTVNCTIYCEYSNPSIINNIISYGTMGIYIDHSSPNVIGNEITNHSGGDYGAGIRCRFTSSPLIANNTIANNTANTYGGGLYTDYSSSPIVKNTILWGNFAPNNQGTQLALDQTSFPTFYNCDIEGGSAAFYYYDAPNTFSGTYVNNINSNPLFINPSGNYFSLQFSSSCINAGDNIVANLPSTDLTGNSRICNSVIEIGAYEICETNIQDFSGNKMIVAVYPNPVSDNLTIEIFSPEKKYLSIYNLLGEAILKSEIQNPKSEINISTLCSGVYSVEVRDGKGNKVTRKIVKM